MPKFPDGLRPAFAILTRLAGPDGSHVKQAADAIEELAARLVALEKPTKAPALANGDTARLDQIDEERLKIADRFDYGEINYRDALRQQMVLEREAADIRAAMLWTNLARLAAGTEIDWSRWSRGTQS